MLVEEHAEHRHEVIAVARFAVVLVLEWLTRKIEPDDNTGEVALLLTEGSGVMEGASDLANHFLGWISVQAFRLAIYTGVNLHNHP